MTGQWIDDKTYWEDPKDKPAFALGDRVEKVGGRYGGPGRVVSVSEDHGRRLPAVRRRHEGRGRLRRVRARLPGRSAEEDREMTEKGKVFVGGLPDAQPRGRVNNAAGARRCSLLDDAMIAKPNPDGPAVAIKRSIKVN